jgi:hypothetical protein
MFKLSKDIELNLSERFEQPTKVVRYSGNGVKGLSLSSGGGFRSYSTRYPLGLAAAGLGGAGTALLLKAILDRKAAEVSRAGEADLLLPTKELNVDVK